MLNRADRLPLSLHFLLPRGARREQAAQEGEDPHETMDEEAHFRRDLPDDGGGPTTDIVEAPTNLPVSYNGRIVVNEDHKNIAIYDASGKMIGRSNSHFNMHSLPSGVYMVYVQGVKGALKITRP